MNRPPILGMMEEAAAARYRSASASHVTLPAKGATDLLAYIRSLESELAALRDAFKEQENG